MKKTKKTTKKTVTKKALSRSSQQTEEKSPIKSSLQTEKKAPLKSSAKIDTKGIKKQYLKAKPACKVTFRLPKDAAPGAKTVSVVGDFNNWNVKQSRMKKLSNGDYTLTMELPCSKEYSFRYLIDAEKWENDWFADKYIPNEYGEDNSVVVV